MQKFPIIKRLPLQMAPLQQKCFLKLLWKRPWQFLGGTVIPMDTVHAEPNTN